MGEGVLLVNDGYASTQRSCTKSSEGRLVSIVSVLFCFQLKKGGRGQAGMKARAVLEKADLLFQI